MNSISSRLSATALSNTVASAHSVSAPARQPDLTGIVHTQESLRFCEHAVIIMKALGQVISCFSDQEELPSTTKELEKTHGVGIQQQRVGYTHRPGAMGRRLAPFVIPLYDTPGGWNGRQATVLQAGWKGYLVREILTAARTGTKENLSVAKTLQQMWAPVESDLEKHVVSLLSCRIRMSFIARYVITYEELVFMTEASAVQQNDSDRNSRDIECNDMRDPKVLNGSVYILLFLIVSLYFCLKPHLKDEVLKEEQRRERSENFQSFQSLIWDNILEQRKQEKSARKEMMKRQLGTYIGFQDTMDAYRQKMLQAREAFCSHILKEQSHKNMEDPPLETVEQVEHEKIPTVVQSSGCKSGGKRT
ncbi:hypothetical protein cypCar_00033289 [Cyprinus carpio]|nr:hypothetical protein cypCar_00033289 [Cyprinus carpio]